MSMFTGIIEEIGTVEDVRRMAGGIKLKVRAPRSAPELLAGNSVSVNGVCLTVVTKSDVMFEVEVVEETLGKTTLGTLRVDESVNLELPLKVSDRFAGHMVLGHVDTVGTITKIDVRGNSWMFNLSCPEKFLRYVVPVGSIAVDGVSLTVAEIGEKDFGVSIIPYTREHTTFQFRYVRDRVNVEFDVMGKYIEQLLERRTGGWNEKEFLSEKHLRELGY